MAAATVTKISQPTLPGWQAYVLTKSEIPASGKAALDPDWEAHQKFMRHLAGKFGREVSLFYAWADEDGVAMKAEFIFTVGSEQNVYDEANEGPAGRIHRVGIKLSECKVDEA